ncbi:MAG TPA: hypothetical protein VFX58_16945 [Chitinophagaceae bacterium]|nr:hypothetical protein [Chitinophagaceae bacterium]
MKKPGFICLLLAFVFACTNKNENAPDLSGINADVAVHRFDQDFFSLDSNNLLPGLNSLYAKYPVLTPIFLQNILGLDSISTLPGVKNFLHLSRPIWDTVNQVFRNISSIEKDFEKAFRYVKYYFPDYKLPNLVTVVGPVDALARSSAGYTPDFLGPDFLGISLQFYLGADYPVYKDAYFVEAVAPAYRSRRFSKEYIIGDGMQLIVDDLFPDQSSSKPLIEQMIERGKQWFLLDKFLPGEPDSVKTGYTAAQLKWCEENEGLIWSYIIKNEDLYALDPVTIHTYIGEGPFTQGFSQELSPGNLGQWIGWRIVQKYAEKNPSLHPREIMKASPKTILDEAKYRPK